MTKKKILTKTVYAQNQMDAKTAFRKTSPDKYIPIRAMPAGTKHGAKIYLVYYRLRKGEY